MDTVERLHDRSPLHRSAKWLHISCNSAAIEPGIWKHDEQG